MSPVIICEADKNDLSTIADLDSLVCYPSVPLEALEAWYSDRGKSRMTFRLAYSGNEATGYVLSSKRKRRLLIKRLAVSPFVRRCGIGTCLMNHVLGTMSSKYPRCEYTISARLISGCRFLAKKGFEIEDKYEGTHFDYYRFVYDLYQKVPLDDCQIGEQYLFRNKGTNRTYVGTFNGMEKRVIHITNPEGIRIGMLARLVTIHRVRQ